MPGAAATIPRIVSTIEVPTSSGWRYTIQLEHPHSTSTHTLNLTLSWVDHDYWTGGTLAPSTTIERIVETLLNARIAIPARADCSTLRRFYPGLDLALMGDTARLGHRGSAYAA